jgi:hypothetical protein
MIILTIISCFLADTLGSRTPPRDDFPASDVIANWFSSMLTNIDCNFNSLLKRGFKWAGNSCAFDNTVTIFFQYFFEYFRNENVDLSFFGHLGRIALSDTRYYAESSYDLEGLKPQLEKLFANFGK